ncbi:ABC transporter permease [Lentibacillus sediminis]|uniref:ABC transporter permease n=1 Tax=Lentibacillus sediminis TaxID=1940529 RepID=UPI000C1BB0AB|nr:ABC transporter permease subunit [Lentibacillus sediminis]
MFLKLVQNEWMKLFNRTSTYVMLGLLAAGVLTTAIFTYYQQQDQQLPSQEQWQAELQSENETLAQQEAETNNYYIESDAINQQAINNYRLEHNLSPYETENVWTYMDSNTGLIQFIGMLVIIVAASIVAQEFKQGTIKLLLVRSASRTQVLAAKFAVTLLFGLFLLVSLFAMSFAVRAIVFGFDGSTIHITASNGEVIEWSRIIYLGVTYLAGSVTMLMLAAFAFMISTVFRNDSIAIAISVMLLFAGTMATNILALLTDWAKFSLFANTNLEQYFRGGPMVEGMTLGFSVVVLVVYLVVFLVLAFGFFNKRDVSI